MGASPEGQRIDTSQATLRLPDLKRNSCQTAVSRDLVKESRFPGPAFRAGGLAGTRVLSRGGCRVRELGGSEESGCSAAGRSKRSGKIFCCLSNSLQRSLASASTVI